MANTKSAIKRARQNDKRRERNQSLRSHAKTLLKNAVKLIESSSSREDAMKALKDGERVLRKAASKKVIPTERVSRKVSRLATMVNKKFAEKRA